MLILFCSKLGIVYWLMSVKMQIWLSYCPTSTAHLLSLWLDVGFVAVCLSEGIGQRSLDLGKLFLFHAFWNSVCGRTKAVAGGFPPGESGRYLEILPGRSQMSVFVLFFFFWGGQFPYRGILQSLAWDVQIWMLAFSELSWASSRKFHILIHRHLLIPVFRDFCRELCLFFPTPEFLRLSLFNIKPPEFWWRKVFTWLCGKGKKNHGLMASFTFGKSCFQPFPCHPPGPSSWASSP